MKKFKLFFILLICILLSGCENLSLAGKQNTLIFGICGGAPTTLDVTKSTLLTTQQIASTMVEGLLKISSEDGTLQPCLAEKIPESPDGTTYIFNLKKGVKFHNGADLTTEDVVFSFERAKNSGYAFDLNLIEEIKILNKSQIKFKLKNYDFRFLNYTCTMPIFPKKACKEAGKKWGVEEIIGTGPFFLKNLDLNTEINLKKFENYHGELAKIDGIDFKVFGENSTMMMEFEAGNLDFMILDDKFLDNYKNSEFNKNLHNFDSMGIFYIRLNLNEKPWDNIYIREAFSYAINTEELCKGLFAGVMTPAARLTNPTAIGFNPLSKIKKYNPKKSIQILKDSGITTPIEIEIILPSNDTAIGMISAAIQQQARSGGFEIKIRQSEKAVYASLRNSSKIPFSIVRWHLQNTEDSALFNFHSKRSRNASSNYNNPSFDKILDESRSTLSTKKRGELYKKADEMLVNQDFAAIPIGFTKTYYLISDRVKNFKLSNINFPWNKIILA